MKKKIKIIYGLYLLSVFLLVFFSISSVKAADDVVLSDLLASTANKKFSINLDESTIARGYTVTSFNDSLKLSLVPGILSSSTRVGCEVLNEDIPTPWHLDRISPFYQFEFFNKASYDNHKPFYIQVNYDTETFGYKRVFFYDKNFSAWRELPTTDFPKEKFVRSLIHLPYARIAVFEDSSILAVGKASWYKYKGGDFTASPDYPKGSRLRVYNLDNGKYVDVTVNDYGPDRRLHPDRVIDLDKVAFTKIASVGEGIINVKVEPLNVAADARGQVLGIKAVTGALASPEIKSKAAVVINKKDGQIIFGQNATTSLPLASLSKMVALKVFFDQRPTLNQIVEYKIKDEEYNSLYTDLSRSSKIKVKDGDKMTIEDLVYSALVGSANNAVESLVRVSGLERNVFITKMNEFVTSLGVTQTKFIEPTGLSEENKTSAYDYAIIIREVLKNPFQAKVSATSKYKFDSIDAKGIKTPHPIYNTNTFLRDGLFALENNLTLTSSKTGYIDEIGYCLMTSATQDGQEVIAVVLGATDKTQSLEEIKDLLLYGFKKLKN
ncbi:MAG: RlpA-like double-psi beta-barrel domain-containing protein [Patescibacteria group bacterium]|jgi:D-alanyl-D-alanine carboxypeptidase